VKKSVVDDNKTSDDGDQMDVDGATGTKPSAMTLPPPHPSSPRAAGLYILKQDPTYELAGTDLIHLELQDFHSLFTLAPQIHPHLGSAVWQLKNGIALREEQLEDESRQMEASWKVWAEEKTETDRSFEMLFNGQLMASRLGDNAQAGPGPRSSAAAAIDASKARTDPQARDSPSLSGPSTPVFNQALPSGLPNDAGSGSRSVPLDRPLPELERVQLRPQPGPGGIIVRPGRGLGTGRLPPHLQAAGLMDYGGGSRREMILRELEARKLYKVMDDAARGDGRTGSRSRPRFNSRRTRSLCTSWWSSVTRRCQNDDRCQRDWTRTWVWLANVAVADDAWTQLLAVRGPGVHLAGHFGMKQTERAAVWVAAMTERERESCSRHASMYPSCPTVQRERRDETATHHPRTHTHGH
jgi:hypothetical protein